MINQENEFNAYESIPEIDLAQIQFDAEKREMRSNCNKIGLMMIIATVVFFIFSILVFVSYTIILKNHTLPSFIDSVPENIISGLANVTAIGICGLAFIKFTKKDISDVLIFKKTESKKLFAIVAIGFAVCMLSNVMTSLYLETLASMGLDLNLDIETPDSNSFFEIIVYFISTAIVPAFSEEILFRGAVLSSLRKYGDSFAIFVSSALFGLFHGNFVQIPFAFVVGLVLAWSVVYTNSMLPAIIIHAANNGFSVLCDVLYTNADSLYINKNLIDAVSLLFVGAIAVLALIAVIMLSKNDKNFLKTGKYEGVLDRKTRTKMLVTSPTIIISSAMLLVESLSTHLSV